MNGGEGNMKRVKTMLRRKREEEKEEERSILIDIGVVCVLF